MKLVVGVSKRLSCKREFRDNRLSGSQTILDALIVYLLIVSTFFLPICVNL
jgi:hypothetical protein